jgi:hypothetical protein
MVGVVGDGGKVLKHLADTLFDEGIVAVLLDLNEVGNVDDFVDLTELSSFGFAILLNR